MPDHSIRSASACQVPERTLSLNSSSASATRFLADLAERSFCGAAAMAYLFYSAGRRCEPGLTFALLGAGYEAHESTLTCRHAPTASKIRTACASSSDIASGMAIQPDATIWLWLAESRSSL